MATRHDRFAATAIPSFAALGWPDPVAASQLLAAMTAEIAVREFDAGARLPGARGPASRPRGGGRRHLIRHHFDAIPSGRLLVPGTAQHLFDGRPGPP